MKYDALYARARKLAITNNNKKKLKQQIYHVSFIIFSLFNSVELCCSARKKHKLWSLGQQKRLHVIGVCAPSAAASPQPNHCLILNLNNRQT